MESVGRDNVSNSIVLYCTVVYCTVLYRLGAGGWGIVSPVKDVESPHWWTTR